MSMLSGDRALRVAKQTMALLSNVRGPSRSNLSRRYCRSGFVCENIYQSHQTKVRAQSPMKRKSEMNLVNTITALELAASDRQKDGVNA